RTKWFHKTNKAKENLRRTEGGADRKVRPFAFLEERSPQRVGQRFNQIGLAPVGRAPARNTTRPSNDTGAISGQTGKAVSASAVFSGRMFWQIPCARRNRALARHRAGPSRKAIAFPLSICQSRGL